MRTLLLDFVLCFSRFDGRAENERPLGFAVRASQLLYRARVSNLHMVLTRDILFRRALTCLQNNRDNLKSAAQEKLDVIRVSLSEFSSGYREAR